MAGIKFGPSSEDDAKPIPEVEAVRDPDSLKQKKKPKDMRRKGPVLCSHPLLRIVARKEDTIFVGRRKKDVAKECFTVQGRTYKVMHQHASGSNRRESPRRRDSRRCNQEA